MIPALGGGVCRGNVPLVQFDVIESEYFEANRANGENVRGIYLFKRGDRESCRAVDLLSEGSNH